MSENRSLAKNSDETRVREEIQLVVFKLAMEEYAIDIGHVSEIRKMLAITRVPKTPEYYLGVMNLRGSVLPVIDLKKRLSLPSTAKTEDSRIIILSVDDISFGVTVDAVSEVSIIDKADIEPPSSIDTNVENRFVVGVGKHNNRLLIMLSVKEIVGLA
ncbi:MAG: chemotaxis protein CheW [Acidaminococcales bacterium]|jgi:purine-binding chemotaxis protein CheW|nr:chemotaxis protein CheW [Acidaminococcales bacterium]